jgi:activating signal cointegrator complex subunit 3
MLPHVETDHLYRFFNGNASGGKATKTTRIDCLPILLDLCEKNDFSGVIEDLVGDMLDRTQIREIYQTLAMLPKIEMRFSLTGTGLSRLNANISQQQHQQKQSDRLFIDDYSADGGGSNKMRPINLLEDEEYCLNVDIKSFDNKRKFSISSSRRGGDLASKAYAPKFPKPKDENWVMILGSSNTSTAAAEGGELIALKRQNALKRQSGSSHLTFRTPQLENDDRNDASTSFNVTFYLMSDVYLGLDQQFAFKFNLVKNRDA